ncbi:hypothetical protein ABIF91_005949 [Bradyrhizobium sp. USDA 241]
MFLSASWRGADEDEFPDQPFVLSCDLLGNAAAERKAQQVDLRKAEEIDEGECIPRHRSDIVRRLAGRATDPSIVECDDGAIGGKTVDDGGIPRINVAGEVLQEN